jgi:hypothetical protein
MRTDRKARPEYAAAFREIVARIAGPLQQVPKRALPIRMYVAGGAALHFHTGHRISDDVDAAFSHRVALPDNLEVAYRDADGAARLLYFDRQYSDTFALLHEDAYDDSEPLSLLADDPDTRDLAAVVDVRILSPLDLAVSKISRFSSQDRDDIAALAHQRLIRSSELSKRAQAALHGYVGDLERLKTSIEMATRIVEDIEQRRTRRK